MVNITRRHQDRIAPSAAPSGDANRVVVEAVVGPTGDRAIVVQRREDLLDRLQNGINATDVKKCLLLTRKRGIGQVFRCCARPHSEGHLAIGRIACVAGKSLVSRPDVCLQIGWNWAA
jgi:hypothetical protein